MSEQPRDLTVEILREIRDQIAKLTVQHSDQISKLTAQQSETNELIKVLVSSHTRLNERVDQTNGRLDRLTQEIIKGRTHDAARLLDHDARLARIEVHLGFDHPEP